MKKLGVILAVCLLTMGCAVVNVRTIPYESAPRSPKPQDYIIEVIDIKDIDRPYKVIGVVDANAGKKHDTADVLGKIKEAAKDMGGDAIIELQSQPIGGGVPYQGGMVYSGHIRDLWRAKVIVYDE